MQERCAPAGLDTGDPLPGSMRNLLYCLPQSNWLSSVYIISADLNNIRH